MTEDERQRDLRNLQRQMQHVWNTIEAMEKNRQRTHNMWVKFEMMEIEENKLLRAGRMVA